MADKKFPSRIELPADAKAKLVDVLNQQLADITDLRTQTKHAHWNVKGPNFYQLHLLFDQLAEALEGPIDDIAERAAQLGGVARGTARDVVRMSKVAEFPEVFDGMKVVTALADRYATAGNDLRRAIDEADKLGDKDTADLFTEVSREVDKSLWFLEAHLHGDR